MTKKTVTLHIYAKVGQYDTKGDISVFDCDFRGIETCMRNLEWLASQEVELDLPEHDLTQVQIDKLKRQIEQERADSQVRVNLLLERISKIQAISHDG